MSTANVIDIIALVPILYGLVRGIFRGFVQELTAIAVVIVGYIVTKLYAPKLAVYLTSVVTWNQQICQVVAYIAIFFGVAIVLTIISKLLSKFLKAVSLGFFNRIFGGLLGAAKWALLVSVILNVVLLLNQHFQFLQPDALNGSYAVAYVSRLASVAWDSVKGAML